MCSDFSKVTSPQKVFIIILKELVNRYLNLVCARLRAGAIILFVSRSENTILNISSVKLNLNDEKIKLIN